MITSWVNCYRVLPLFRAAANHQKVGFPSVECGKMKSWLKRVLVTSQPASRILRLLVDTIRNIGAYLLIW